MLVNNAGIAGAAPIDQYPLADWEKIVAVNLTGAFNGIQAVVPAMKKAGGSSIVDISPSLRDILRHQRNSEVVLGGEVVD